MRTTVSPSPALFQTYTKPVRPNSRINNSPVKLRNHMYNSFQHISSPHQSGKKHIRDISPNFKSNGVFWDIQPNSTRGKNHFQTTNELYSISPSIKREWKLIDTKNEKTMNYGTLKFDRPIHTDASSYDQSQSRRKVPYQSRSAVRLGLDPEGKGNRGTDDIVVDRITKKNNPNLKNISQIDFLASPEQKYNYKQAILQKENQLYTSQ